MGIEYRIDHERRLVTARGHGTFTEADAFQYQREVWSRPDVAGYDELIDMTDVVTIVFDETTSLKVRDLASEAAAADHPSVATRLGIVAPQDVAYGMGRMFQAFRELNPRTTKQVGVFQTMAEALAFLGRDAAPR